MPRSPKPPPPWRRESAGRYVSADARFTVETGGPGYWYVADDAERDELGLPRRIGPFGTLDEAKTAAAARRDRAPEVSPLRGRLEEARRKPRPRPSKERSSPAKTHPAEPPVSPVPAPTPAPFPTSDMSLTALLVVSDVERSKRWYGDVLGAHIEGEYGGTSCVLRFLDAWLLLVTGGPPTSDKPTVVFGPPADPDRVAAELIIGVPDCRAAYATLASRGASFLTAPVEYPNEVRAFFRDPDGHLFEISERRRNPEGD